MATTGQRLSQNPKIIDVAIVVALEEEYNIFSKNAIFSKYKSLIINNVGISQFVYKDSSGKDRIGIFVRVDGMAEQARDAVHMVRGLYDATYWISAGISGALSSDVHPGDIILSDVVLSPLELSKAQPSEKGFDLKLAGGRPTIGSPDINALAQRWRDGLEEQQSFERDSRTRLDSIVGRHQGDERLKIERALEPILARKPSLFVGPIAGGPILSAAKEFKDKLLGSNRKLLAYDMETNEVGGALAALNQSGRFLAIRTVSDYGDGGKNAFEEVTKGAVRNWALRGLTDFLAFTLRKGLPYPKQKRTTAPSPTLTPRTTKTHAPVKHLGGRLYPDPFAAHWDMRYRAIISDDAFPQLTEPVTTLGEALKDIRDGKRTTIVIAGPSGSGKTVLLDLLAARWGGGKQARIATGDPTSWHRDPDEPIEIAAKQFAEQSGIDGDDPVLVIVDDIDLESTAGRILVGTLDRMAERSRGCCLVFGVSTGEPRLDHFPEGVNVDYWVPLTSAAPGTAACDEFIGSFEPLLKEVKSSVTLPELRKRITTFAPRSIDPQFISVLLENWSNARFSSVRTAAQFAIQTAQLLGNSACEGTLPADFVDLCAADAFARYSGDTPSPLPSGPIAKAFQKVRRTGEWVQEALVAEFVVRVVTRAGQQTSLQKLELSALQRVYDTRVTGLVKQIVQNSDNGQVLKGIERLLGEYDVSIAPFLVYILGRITDPRYKPIAQRLLVELSEASAENFDGWSNSSGDDRVVSLAHRAVYISRAYQGDRETAKKYVSLLARDPEESALNRGFHLEYFRDRIVRPKAGLYGYMLSDDASGPWSNTYKVLYDSIDGELDTGALTAKGIIELGTFCSFVAVRLDRGELAAELRTPISVLLGRAVNRGDPPAVLAGVCNAMIHELSQPPVTGPYALFKTVFALKHEERAGWRTRHISNRLGAPTERVASHIYGACLLALWLLPEKPPTIFPYNKERVIRLLMLHDVGEAITGDQTPDEKNADPGAEARAVARIAGMAMMPALNNLSGLYEDWQEFEEALSNEAKLARDIDYLEALMQATLYRAQFPSEANYDEFVRYHRERIRTPPGHEILDAILRGADLAAQPNRLEH